MPYLRTLARAVRVPLKAGGVTTELLGSTGIWVAGAASVAVTLTNSGAVDVATLAAYWSNDPTGAARWGQDANLSLPAGWLVAGGASRLFSWQPTPGPYLRLRLVATTVALAGELTVDVTSVDASDGQLG